MSAWLSFFLLIPLLAANLASAAPVGGYKVDVKYLRENIKTCSPSLLKDEIEYFKKLSGRVLIDYEIQMAGASMVDFALLQEDNLCRVGLLKNSVIVLTEYLRAAPQGGFELAESKMDIARAKIILASFYSEKDQSGDYGEADVLIEQYLKEGKVDAEGVLATPYYFAANGYLDAAGLVSGEKKIGLLNNAISVAKRGKEKVFSKKQRSELSELMIAAMIEKKKYYQKNSPEYKNNLNELIALWEERFDDGDAESGYNAAVGFALLEDAANAKIWLQRVAERNVDYKICGGLFFNADLDWLRLSDPDWMVDYMMAYCRNTTSRQ
ncbi:MAG: hypothetical protein JO142_09580 [Burkholderiales bacterium]|nr:hypothetical protein [Burkholderiales bacterium]